MLTVFLKSIGLVHASEQPLLPRHLDVSGTLVSFAMPENFSRDFPADDMRESVDLDQPGIFSSFSSVLILQRYWDFSAKSLFAGKQGTLQLTMAVKKVENGQKLDLSSRDSLILAISSTLQNTYDAANHQKQESDKIRYSNLRDDFVDFDFNNQHWIRYSIWKDDSSELTSVYAIPVRDDAYLTVAFAFSPSDGASMRKFVDEYAQPLIDQIMITFRVKYNLAKTSTREQINSEIHGLDQSVQPEQH